MNDNLDRWRRIEEICQAALERDAAERSAFVAAACGADDHLRREVEALLSKEHAAAGFLSQPPGAVAAAAFRSSGGRSLIGRQVGSYDIVGLLGAGGMGEVYRAHDRKLGRDVAIKVLPGEFVADRERLARFEREARVLASLNHPNIAAIYGLEDLDGVQALVLELVDGETLAQRIRDRAIGDWRSALAIARQIAEALEAAHEKGIVHRDLKPANIKLTPAGTVKVLDFGLAKTDVAQGSSLADASHSPTLTIGGTRDGVLLGTAAYMSPEQARGQAVDKRADIWAFGCVLFEMLTTRLAFSGATVSDHIAAILEREPDWSALPATTPPVVQRLLRRCLEKDPKRRLHDIADARIEIEDAMAAPTSSSLSTPPSQSRWMVRSAAAVALTAVIATSATIAWSRWTGRSTAVPLTRFVVQPAELVLGTTGFDISPDGRQIVYAGRQGTTVRLFLRRLEQFEAAPIPGTEGALNPFFSQDGDWIAYFAGDKLHKVNIREPAPPVVLCTLVDRGNLFGAWMNTAVLFTGRNHGVMRVPADGGEPVPLMVLDSTREIDHHTPSVLPGDQAVLFAIHQGENRFSVAVESLATRKRKILIESGFAPRYLAPDHIVFARGSAILAAPFDLARLEVTAAPVTLVEHVETSPRNGEAVFALSANGTLVFEPERSRNGRILTWVDRAGQEVPLPIPARAFRTPSVSRDGKRLAFAVEEDDRHDVWTYEIAADKLTRITRDGDNQAPLWTPDGQRLAYDSVRSDGVHLMWEPADGSGSPESLLKSRNLLWPGAWSADDRDLVYVEQPPTDEPRILLLRLESRRTERLVSGDGRHPTVSVDGRWLAFGSSSTEGGQIYVSPFPQLTSRQQVTADGGREAKWRRDGRELFYRGLFAPSRRALFAVPVDTTRAFSAGKPLMLFEITYVTDIDHGLDYDVAPDGRFLMIKPGAEESRPRQLNVVASWGSELTRRVPTGK